jgi:hypothetical protein
MNGIKVSNDFSGKFDLSPRVVAIEIMLIEQKGVSLYIVSLLAYKK